MPEYRGKSQFFKSPAGRALAQLQMPDDVEQSGAPMPGMRSGLRSALANAEGEARLRTLRRGEPTVFEREGSPDVPGVFGQPRQEFYIPDRDDPIAAAETARQQGRANAYLEEDLAAQIEPTMAGRAEDIRDFQESRATRRYYDPQNFARGADEFARKFRLATAPAQLAAGSRERVADITGQSRIGAVEARRPSPEELALENFPDMARGGGFGIDPRTGRPMGAPEDVQRDAVDLIRRMLQGGGVTGGRGGGAGPGGGGGVAPGGPPGASYSPDDEALIAQGTAAVDPDTGQPFTRAQVIEYLRSKGMIR